MWNGCWLYISNSLSRHLHCADAICSCFAWNWLFSAASPKRAIISLKVAPRLHFLEQIESVNFSLKLNMCQVIKLSCSKLSREVELGKSFVIFIADFAIFIADLRIFCVTYNEELFRKDENFSTANVRIWTLGRSKHSQFFFFSVMRSEISHS